MTTAGSLTARVSQSNADYSPTNGSGLNASALLQRYFTLTNNGIVLNGSTGNFNATFNFVAGDVVGTASNYIVRRYSGSQWAAPVSSVNNNPTLSVTGTGFKGYGDFVIGEPAAEPTIVANALQPFGSVCINTTSGPNTFTITGTNLDGSNVTVAALAGFSYSADGGTTYLASLSIPASTSFSQQILVKFTPTNSQAYDGNIVIGGGGAANYSVAASGSGINTPPSVSTGSASSVTSTSAILAGSLASTGCTSLSEYGFYYSTTSGFVDGAGTKVTASNLSGSAFSYSLAGLNISSAYYFKAFATNSGGTSYGAQGTFTTLTPSITLGPLAAFGNVCINTTSNANPFTVSGSNLTTADVTVAALNGYSYSLSSGGTYTSTLSIPQSGGTLASTSVYVKFSPTLVQLYSGNIVVGGGGAANGNVAASGSGVNTAPTVAAGTTGSIDATSETVNGIISSIGCSPVTAYGIYYSTTPGFADGAGTPVTGSNLSSSSFSVTVSSLSANTTYYFKVYAINSGGTSYSAEASFTTASLIAPVATAGTAVTSTGFTANWGTGTGATSYNLDVSTISTFGTTSSSSLIEGFNSVGSNGTPVPSGWTFTSIGGNYTSSGNYGVSSPSIQMDATSDRVQTPTIGGQATSLSFWIKGRVLMQLALC